MAQQGRGRQIKELYSIGQKLGTGGFAVVRKCKRRGDGQVFALKVINKKNLEQDDLQILDVEVSIMQQIAHPNIVALHDVFDSRTKMCLVLDLLEGGELFDRIIEKGHFTESAAANSFRQMVEALGYLHQQGIVHRDLKPENLLFDSREDDSPIKLIDFGLAGRLVGDAMLRTPCGTPNYVAPEILRRQEYGTQADMWSSGVILYIILCGFPPFYDENDDLRRLYRKIKNADFDMPSPYWDNISDGAKNLVQNLLVSDPAQRFNADQALAHEWVAGNAPDTRLDAGYLVKIRQFQILQKLQRGVRGVLAVVKLIDLLRETGDDAVEQS